MILKPVKFYLTMLCITLIINSATLIGANLLYNRVGISRFFEELGVDFFVMTFFLLIVLLVQLLLMKLKFNHYYHFWLPQAIVIVIYILMFGFSSTSKGSTVEEGFNILTFSFSNLIHELKMHSSISQSLMKTLLYDVLFILFYISGLILITNFIYNKLISHNSTGKN